MAQSMRDIKDKINSTQNTSQITKAMQMVSAAKLTKSEAKTKNYHHYMETLEDMVRNISSSSSMSHHPFFKSKSEANCTGYLVITSDRGLAGGYNSNVLKLLQQQIDSKPSDQSKLYMIGSKGFDYAKRSNLVVENEFVFVPDDIVYQDIKPVVDKVIGDYMAGVISEVVVVYNHYVSKIAQEPMTKQILPLESKKAEKSKAQYSFEPKEEDVINAILPKYLEGTIYGVAITAKLSEHASRMNAMQNATDNAVEIIKNLQLVYNRARQAAITQEITEIVGGASALE
ncbi:MULTISPECIES: ATP synthase F1 subunit gamma [Turicibacter]|uniref:ATP synthase gamma chain n=3 Tax=Bacteria TaxID=2 RepID=A0A173RE73_9FIRM|nr:MULTISPECIES: ATP synthase F1 subunit gamma [Turicibacter]EFF63825.1 ATP synthase F1, gamma subunit [Turicibacter sanguinis PC909]EGC93448.1 ATP synthase F1, gamma subunit [Turicibacter sp. HGF1]MCU7191518.1 ATP synthase F1 subunit gamma [Turicibacter sanguinis]MCU7195430.1 ATP synthase F1 subunit gamma [Turicibacter sanguinis]MCU7201614.1 ATP synthase F1 subunit gamma [Turicibacter sanguinis]